MKYFLTEKAVGFFARKLDGKKSIIGGVGMILLGLAGAIGHFYPDLGLPQMPFDEAAGYVVAGFSVLGIAGKIAKSGKG